MRRLWTVIFRNWCVLTALLGFPALQSLKIELKAHEERLKRS